MHCRYSRVCAALRPTTPFLSVFKSILAIINVPLKKPSRSYLSPKHVLTPLSDMPIVPTSDVAGKDCGGVGAYKHRPERPNARDCGAITTY